MDIAARALCTPVRSKSSACSDQPAPDVAESSFPGRNRPVRAGCCITYPRLTRAAVGREHPASSAGRHVTVGQTNEKNVLQSRRCSRGMKAAARALILNIHRTVHVMTVSFSPPLPEHAAALGVRAAAPQPTAQSDAPATAAATDDVVDISAETLESGRDGRTAGPLRPGARAPGQGPGRRIRGCLWPDAGHAVRPDRLRTGSHRRCLGVAGAAGLR